MTRIEVHRTTIRRGWMAFVMARPRGKATFDIIQAFFGTRREDVEADAQQYRAALQRGVMVSTTPR